jgi:hypothetical protein
MSAASVGLAARSATGDRVSDMAFPSGRRLALLVDQIVYSGVPDCRSGGYL